MAAAREAKENMANAEKALKTSWVGLKFSPDYISAAMHYSDAATKFRSAGMLEDSIKAWVKAAEVKEKNSDIFGAGRAYESAGAICDGGGPGGKQAASAHWEKAIRCFRLCAKSEIAVKLILKRAEVFEKDGDVGKAKECFDEAIDIYTEDEKDYQLAEVYKSCIGLLLRAKKYDDALKAIDGHIGVLCKGKHFSFAHKEILAKAVLHLTIGDPVRADQSLTDVKDVEGWFSSKEAVVGGELVQAFLNHDAEGVEAAKKQQVFSFLQVEIARLAKSLKVADLASMVGRGAVPTPAAAPAGAAAPAPAPAKAAASPTAAPPAAATTVTTATTAPAATPTPTPAPAPAPASGEPTAQDLAELL
eukprot:CAMPEP_0206565832 /NCGR_PEP_ID=MMETSP0325_2-20121206/24313_1 /ASSEMBLY_ACC=CAM_ASM_000347 /TAXON_ID=2866 /ORGANISM="Crypthecodinium cohnii, Strain Seligo" /LENGTH=360 /DNA_ID=CAMNT_0054068777 /DNA_START=51 /DNA_END=1130 /DNA_ORIENTATION=+